MLPAYPIGHTTILVLIFSRQETIAIFPPNQVNKSLQRVGKQKLCTTPPAVSRHQEETQMRSWRRLCRGHKDRLVRLFDPVPNVWEQITRVLQSYLVF